MVIAIQTPEILQLLNNVIVNIVTLIETFFPWVFMVSLIALAVWIIYELVRGLRDAILKT